MTGTEHLLVILMEECLETAHRVSKALRFGLDEKEPGQEFTNVERISQEYIDIAASMVLLSRVHPGFKPNDIDTLIEKKFDKVKKYLEYSVQCGTLQEG